MQRLRTAHKLWLAVFLIVVALLGVLGFSGYRSARLQAESERVTEQMRARVEASLRWMGMTEANAARTQALVVSSDPVLEAEFKEVIAATSAKISEVQKSLEAMPLADADRAQMQTIAAARKTMLELRVRALQLRGDGRHDEAVQLIASAYKPAVAAYLQTLQDFVQLQQRAAQHSQQAMAVERQATVRLAALAIAVLLAAIVWGARFLVRSIQAPLQQAQQLAERIAGGDLRAGAAVARGDEFGDLLRSLQAMCEALGRMVAQVHQSSHSIALASTEIAAGNQDLSARTEQTSSSLQQTAAAMEQFTGTLQQSAGSARQASGMADGASQAARQGGAVVEQMVATMAQIDQSSQKIAEIIGVIDSIAFQTNILALNAAVEAARAGEQGRGFAVVAGEVRSLAGRSASAAKEIRQLIGASMERVASGTRLAQDAGQAMGAIVESVQQVTVMMAEITAAAAEQSAGVVQVNQAVGQLDQMTQQNAALVEESAAAAQSLREQAGQLAQVVAVFQLDAAGAAREARSGDRPGAPRRLGKSG